MIFVSNSNYYVIAKTNLIKKERHMNSNFLKLLSISLLGVVLSGCLGGQPPIAKSIQPKADKRIVFKQVNDLGGSAITENEIKNTFFDGFKKLSKYREASATRECFNNLGGGVTCDNKIKGVLFVNNKNSFGVEYINGYWKTPAVHVNFDFPVTYSTENEGLAITIKHPSSYSIINDFFATANAKPFDTEENFVADINSIFDKLNSIQTTSYVSRSIKINGEVNTKYNNAAIYANFERLLGVYKWGNSQPSNVDITKEKSFSFKLKDGTIFPLHVKVYPYKAGSKVVYNANVPYRVYLDGKTSITKADLNLIEKEVEKIVND